MKFGSVRRRLGRFKRILFSHLPRDLRLFLEWSAVRRSTVIEPEIFALKQWADAARIAVDAGANNGVIASTLSPWFSRVEAFEPNFEITEPARRYGPENVRFHPFGLSSEAKPGSLTIPQHPAGFAIAGWGTLESYGTAITGISTTIQVQLKTLDEFEFENVAVIKIDVEGHERELLRGAAATIQRCRPVMLCETQTDNRVWISDFASERGYRIWLLSEGQLMPEDRASEAVRAKAYNLILIPNELETYHE